MHFDSARLIWVPTPKNLKEFTLSTFPAEDDLNQDIARCLWSLIFNVDAEFIEKYEGYRKNAWYLWANRRLTLYMKSGESCVKLARRQAALNARIGTTVPMMASDRAWDEWLYLPMTGGRYLFRILVGPDQTEKSVLEIWKVGAQSFSYWFLVLKLYVSYFVLRHTAMCAFASDKNKNISELICIEVVAFLAFYSFIWHRYLQKGGCNWHGCYSLLHHTYRTFSSYNLKNAVASAFGASFTVIKNTATRSGRNEAEQHIDRTSVTNKDGKSDKEENKNEISAEETQNLPRLRIGSYSC